MTRKRGQARRCRLPWTGEGRRSLRLLLAERDGACCFYCRTPADPLTLTFDHFVPQAFVPIPDVWNLVLACDPCNQAKRDQLPRGLVLVLLSGRYNCNDARAA